jgi:nucleoside-diphosphate-sugar epimerase
MKVLITGGAGFIGYHLAKQLAEEKNEVVIMDNFARGKEDKYLAKLLDMSNVTLLTADITDPKQVMALPHDFDVIYHFAAINGTENFYNIPDKVLKVGVLGAINMLEWYSEKPHGMFIVASSSEAYAGALKLLGEKFPIPTPEDVPLVVDDPRNVRWSYGGSKILSEVAMFSYAKARKLTDFAVVRFHNIYGPRMGTEHVIPQFIERLVKGVTPFPIFGGDETRTFCYISDAIDALKIIASSKQAKGQIIHIGRDDDEISIIDVAKKLMEIAHNKADFDIKPAPEGCVKRRCPSISKLKKMGYKPKVSLGEGLKETYAWYREFYLKRDVKR